MCERLVEIEVMLRIEGDSSHSVLFTLCPPWAGLKGLAVFSWIFKRILKCFWCICQQLSWGLCWPYGAGLSSALQDVKVAIPGGKGSEKGGCEWREEGEGAEEGGNEKNQVTLQCKKAQRCASVMCSGRETECDRKNPNHPHKSVKNLPQTPRQKKATKPNNQPVRNPAHTKLTSKERKPEGDLHFRSTSCILWVA